MDRIMYLVKSNIFHIYKLIRFCSLKWSISTMKKDTEIIRACFLKTVQCTTESRKMWTYWIILNSGIQSVRKSLMTFEWRRSSVSIFVGIEIWCMRRYTTFGYWKKICWMSIKWWICIHTKCSIRRHWYSWMNKTKHIKQWTLNPRNSFHINLSGLRT